MNSQELMNASSLIVRSNLNEKIVAVTVVWDKDALKLEVAYYVDGMVSDEERELCDLTLTEMLAEFSDVKIADSRCHSAHRDLEQLKGLVYLR